MTMALIAQAASDRFRKPLVPPSTNWDPKHMAKAYFEGLEGDMQIQDNTIRVTFLSWGMLSRVRGQDRRKPEQS